MSNMICHVSPTSHSKAKKSGDNIEFACIGKHLGDMKILHWVVLWGRLQCPLWWCRPWIHRTRHQYSEEGCRGQCMPHPQCSWMMSQKDMCLRRIILCYHGTDPFPDPEAFLFINQPYQSQCQGEQHWPLQPECSLEVHEELHTCNRPHLWPSAATSQHIPAGDD